MRQSIRTKFLGATGARGSRLKAIASGGESLMISYPHELHHAKRHAFTAFKLAEKLGWHGFYALGPIDARGNIATIVAVHVCRDAHDGYNNAEHMANEGRAGDRYGFEGEDWFYLAIPGEGGTSTEF